REMWQVTVRIKSGQANGRRERVLSQAVMQWLGEFSDAENHHIVPLCVTLGSNRAPRVAILLDSFNGQAVHSKGANTSLQSVYRSFFSCVIFHVCLAAYFLLATVPRASSVCHRGSLSEFERER
ncbi:MAG: hypothetical protein ACTS5I_04485, partial [Rhodanobacter sp.]